MRRPLQSALPPALARGCRVAVVAPAGVCDPLDLVAGLEVLRALGFEPVLGRVVYQRERYLAGGDRQRAADLMRAFLDPSVDGIVCARGGYGTLRILAHLDFDAIGRHAKRLVGFSDVSALIWALNARCGLVAFHGPTVASLADADPETIKGLEAIMAEDPGMTLSLAGGRVLAAGWAVGRLCGGNLTTICHLLGTAFAPRFEGGVLVLEDRGEAPYRIDRMLTQMRLAGALTGVRAVVLGAFTDCGDSQALEAALADRLGDLGVPVMSGLAVGHGPRNLTLPMGMEARLDTHRSTLEVMGTKGRPKQA